MNSEIYGTTTDLPWGFIFVQNGETMAMHPTQLYESLAYLIVFIAMGWAYKYKKAGLYSGRLLGLFLIGIFTFRFFIEFIKHNQVGMEEHMALNLGQYLSIPAILIGIALLIYSSKNKISAPNN
jgi:prolipoprotein diacylglyceryltransferase